MKKLVFLSLSAILALSCSRLPSQELGNQQEILEQMTRANDYFMAKWPDPGMDIVTDKVRPSNLWTRAAYYEGLMALYRINQDSTLYNYAVEWGESHDWKPTYGSPFTVDGDHQCCGQTYIELYQISGEQSWIEPIRENIDNMVNSDRADAWSWVDAIQMSMPVFAKLGVVLDDTSYFRKMYDLYSFTKYQHGANGLYNQEEHLWWRDGDFDPPFTSPNGRQVYWSRGNGWVIAALARVLEVIPEDEPNRAEYEQDLKDMAAALLPLQRQDGFWDSNLGDPNHFGGKETSGTAFFVYGMAWGINHGLLDSATYMPHVIRGWNGMIQDALHDTGFLGWVQSTGKEPKDGQPLAYDKPANFEDYGLGAFLLAGSEVWKLAREVQSGTGLSSSVDDRALLAYPNPSTGNVRISCSTPAGDIPALGLYDLQGKQVREIHGDELRRGEIPAGIYILRMDKGSEMLTRKLILL